MKKKLLLTIFLFLLILIILSFRIFEFFKPFLPHLNYLLGSNQPTTYLFLLGNDTEVRANGGFAGSYAKITLNSSAVIPGPDPESRRETWMPDQVRHDNYFSTIYHLRSTLSKTKSNISFHDIYVPNGQLQGFVKPPDAIQQAFGHGTWELANADYDPNFPTAANSIRWFLEKGNEVNPDILGIINLSTIKKVLNVIGEFKLNDTATITPDNLYLYLQGKAELNFFPGSTQKADALHNVGTAAIKKIKSLSLPKKIIIAQIIWEDLQNKNLVLNSTNSEFQNFLKEKKWAGEYQAPTTTDFYGLVELNLGANKANQYVTRQTTHTVTSSPSSSLREGTPTWQSTQINHQINIQFQNTSPEANPNPPLQYGGNYIAFIRIYLPPNATDINISHTEIATSSAGYSTEVLNNQSPSCSPASTSCGSVIPGTDPESSKINTHFTTVSFWHLTPAGNHTEINLSYNLSSEKTCHSRESGNPSNKNLCPYSLTLLKQNGFPTSPQNLNIFGNRFSTPLFSPFIYTSKQ